MGGTSIKAPPSASGRDGAPRTAHRALMLIMESAYVHRMLVCLTTEDDLENSEQEQAVGIEGVHPCSLVRRRVDCFLDREVVLELLQVMPSFTETGSSFGDRAIDPVAIEDPQLSRWLLNILDIY